MQINTNQRLLDLSVPKVMGVLNLTPDSFYAGSRLNGVEEAVKRAEIMISEGADLLDVGGMSTRSGSLEITEKEETERVIPVIQSILKKFPETLISIDTYRSKVAEKAVNAGAALINDISAGKPDPAIIDVAARYSVPYILMHMQGTPKNMQINPVYEDVVSEVNLFFSEKIKELLDRGVDDIILDPGFGFGKTLDHNYELLSNLELIGFGKFPILTGFSRKSMIWKFLEISPEEALNGTSILNTIALQKGAQILRVHDVKEAVEAVRITEKLKKIHSSDVKI